MSSCVHYTAENKLSTLSFHPAYIKKHQHLLFIVDREFDYRICLACKQRHSIREKKICFLFDSPKGGLSLEGHNI